MINVEKKPTILLITDTEIAVFNSRPNIFNTRAQIASLTPNPPGIRLIKPRMYAADVANRMCKIFI